MLNKMIRKPQWLRKKIISNSSSETVNLLKHGSIRTICQETSCPNITDCFSKKEATYLILGDICTRGCTFCALQKGNPSAPNPNEPQNIARSIKELDLRHAVITSSTRDDLSDGGAQQFCNTVSEIKRFDESIIVELLIPDMRENLEALKKVALSGADIIGHNLETVPRLYHVRKGAEYKRSLRVLEMLHRFNDSIVTKSGIILGLGESDIEVKTLMQDLIDVRCKYLNIAQYTAPSAEHAPVLEYVSPQRFEYLQDMGMQMGFESIISSPYAQNDYMVYKIVR